MRYKNLRILIVLVALLVLAALASRAQGAPPDPNQSDTVWVDSATAFVSGEGVLPVRFFNDEPLSAIAVTLKHNSSTVRFHSFSFDGGRISTDVTRGFRISADSGIITILVVSMSGQPVPTGNGILGYIHFAYDPSIQPELVTIDTITWVPEPILSYANEFSDTLALAFTPEFHKGYLNIKEAPPSTDSIWVSEGTGIPGGEVALDVSLFNERKVTKTWVALEWNSDRLSFDSVSYIGTRGLTFPTKGYQANSHQVLLQFEFDSTSGQSLPIGSGVLARMYFRVGQAAPDTDITIDSAAYLGIQRTFLRRAADDNYRILTPLFHAGMVTIRNVTDVDPDDGADLPTSFALGQNYPNPFNPSTEIEFALPTASQVKLEVYDLLGRRVRELVNGRLEAGVHRITFNASGGPEPLASGVYFYRLSAERFVKTRKMLLIK